MQSTALPLSVMKQSLELPPLSQALIDALDARFPERCADPADTDREIWMKAGERRLVNTLKGELRKQETRAAHKR